ncbi:MAG: hypothetical protein H6622_08420 [Halobacteriovoraceae bacterium]|nr:hypothetical protein [Halobacteriovoraceae bacterium]
MLQKNCNQGDYYLSKMRRAGRNEVFNKIEEILSFDVLKYQYDLLEIRLSESFETTKTSYESRVLKKIKESYKGDIFTSMWIGKRNIDIFIPGLRGNTYEQTIQNITKARYFKGLAIEIDGSIHDQEFKMKKDSSKYRQLHALEIGLLTIENRDIKLNFIQKIIRGLIDMPRVDYRQRRRLFRNIFITTLLAHYTDEELNNLFKTKHLTHLFTESRKIIKL